MSYLEAISSVGALNPLKTLFFFNIYFFALVILVLAFASIPSKTKHTPLGNATYITHYMYPLQFLEFQMYFYICTPSVPALLGR